MSSSGVKTCPECAEEIKLEAKVCRYCGTAFSVVRVGYCLRCHKVVAASDLGVCVVCGSRLIDLRLESQEISGPTIGAKREDLAAVASPAPVPDGEEEPEAEAKPAPSLVPVETPATDESEPQPEPEPEPEDEAEDESEPESKLEVPPAPAAPTPPPGPPPGVPWIKPTDQPAVSSSEVAERLAAFGRRESTPPVAETPPFNPASATVAEEAPGASETAEPEVLGEPETGEAGKHELLGIVPSLAHRIAYPFYLLGVIAVLAMWVIGFIWDSQLEGTQSFGSQTLKSFAVATYGDGGRLFVEWQIGLIAIICALLLPLRLQPKGWFREKGVAKEFSKKLQSSYGVDMLLAHKWYFQKLMLAIALWAIGIAYLVARVVGLEDFVLEMGGAIALGGMLVAFACAGVMAVRRKPLVALDETGRLRNRD